ncbi:hypothetical protein ACFOLL_13185 [Falsochrobactrum ovis]|uniref:Uncharacterized protein n=1 Tax=Falsochrobactrum ovis TaxID=1293442 RepID=A0A364JTG1_9HYPH|nr:hypothetical protein [Falsochrobactrum ovis]RAK27057.1 hypothetical protein C7374_11151 [Falsochrobactrum ovis]
MADAQAMTIPEQAVQAALDHYSEDGCMGLDTHERREVTEAIPAASPLGEKKG